MLDSVAFLRSALGDRYTIERELGRGGYSVVYLAHDTKHDRKVALKVLLPELALAVRAERFLREIQIAAKLSHPHILPLYDSGEANGVVYYVMPYVEGESLRDRLNREKQLAIEDALAIMRDVAAALGYAHKQGVVHRDIKPENILLSEGGAVVADFGIARALTAAGGQTVTEAGIAVGTPAYMSPEQGAGGGEVDARSDIYSLGCVLYEMLAGHPPFTGATAQEILARHALDPLPALEAARPGVSEGVERTVRKALAKRPVDRFATAAQFAEACTTSPAAGEPKSRRRGLAIAGLVVLLGAAALAARTLLVGARPAERSLAVLPFVNLSGDPDNEYLSDGMTEELINALVQIEGLQVPARTSSFYFKGKTLTARQIGESLHVATVLEGSLRKTGNTLRITAQLINAADGYHLWSSTFDRELAGVHDVLSVQEELARAIVAALQPRLAVGDVARPARSYTENVEAYELYLRGRHSWNRRDREGVLKAIDLFRAAIAEDSAYAPAYSGLADAYVFAGEGLQAFLPREDAYLRAKKAALKAIELDDALSEAHASLALVHFQYDRDARAAERQWVRAIQLDPKYVLAHTWYGSALARRGRTEEAIEQLQEAQRLDPLDPTMNFELGRALYFARRYDDAVHQFSKTIELAPSYSFARTFRGRTYCLLGDFDRALVDLQEGLRLSAGAASSLGTMGYCYGLAGRRDAALDVVAQLMQRPKGGEVWQFLAHAYVGLGEKEKALDALQKAYANDADLLSLKVNPVFDPIRQDSRFVRLVARLDLNP